MSSLPIQISPPTREGRLFPKYKASAGTITIESSIKREWRYGVNVDSIVICDLDYEWRLANIDVHWPRSRWSIDESLVWIPGGDAKDVRFAPDVAKARDFADPVEVTTNRDRTIVAVRFGEEEPADAWNLSDDAKVLTAGGTLLGFLIRLPI